MPADMVRRIALRRIGYDVLCLVFAAPSGFSAPSPAAARLYDAASFPETPVDENCQKKYGQNA